MVNEKTITLLQNALPEYNKLVGKDYLIACNINKSHPLSFYVFRIKKENFWHLLGCEVSSNNYNSEALYDLFEKGEDIRQHLAYTSNSHNCEVKYSVFCHLFNFVKYAKEIQICRTEESPEQFMFLLASGTSHGIVGYDETGNNILFPKTIHFKSVTQISSTRMRIAFILSKNIELSSFDKLEYCNSKKYLNMMLSLLPTKYNTILRNNNSNGDVNNGQ